MIDVAVVGAGPAGAWAAYSLATRGARVLLIDPSHPREKPCGGGVTGRALDIVSPAVDIVGSRGALEVAASRRAHDAFSVAACDIRAARFVDSITRRSASVRLAMPDSPPDRDLVVASRAQFDGALVAAARAAGADVLPSRVTDLTAENGGFRIETRSGTVRASRVIGADGTNSLVRRRMARPFRRDQLSIATGFFAHGTTSDEIVIELTSDPPGYIWSFPRPDHLAIGICAQADAGVTAEALRRTTAEWIRRTGVAHGATLQPYSWPIPSLGQRDFDQLDLAGPRWCLAGDAAGLVDPITREGIFFALTSAQWAADALAGSGDLSAYARRVRDEAIPELAYAARLRTMFFRPAFTALMMDALQQSGDVRAVMADLVAGRQPYATLKWRLLRTFELGLAWRAIVSARNIRRAL